MANLKDIREVPLVDSLTGDEKVLLNVDGKARQVRVDQIKPIEEYDLDITVRLYYDEQGDWTGDDFVIHHMSSFETIRDKILNGIVPKVKGVFIREYPEYTVTDLISHYRFGYYIYKSDDYEEIGFYLGGYDGSREFYIESDGSVYID